MVDEAIYTIAHYLNNTLKNNYEMVNLFTEDSLIEQPAIALFTELGKVHVEGEKPITPAIPPEKYEMPLEQLGLSARTFNSLRRSGITKVGELLEKSESDLLALRSFGQKSLEEVNERLETLDLKPKESDEEKKARRSEADDTDEDNEGDEE